MPHVHALLRTHSWYGSCPCSASHMPHVHALLHTHSCMAHVPLLPHTCLMCMRGFAHTAGMAHCLTHASCACAASPVTSGPRQRSFLLEIVSLVIQSSLSGASLWTFMVRYAAHARARARPHTHTHTRTRTHKTSLPPSPLPPPLPAVSLSLRLPFPPLHSRSPLHSHSLGLFPVCACVSIAVPPPHHHGHALPRAHTQNDTPRARTYTRGRLAFMRCAGL